MFSPASTFRLLRSNQCQTVSSRLNRVYLNPTTAIRTRASNQTQTRKMSSTPDPFFSIDQRKIDILKEYNACDISDALLKLQKPPPGKPARAGFLADIVPLSTCQTRTNTNTNNPNTNTNSTKPLVAPASTFKFIPKNDPTPPAPPGTETETETETTSIPPGTHWVDHAQPNTVVVVEQPPHQSCAAVGGIMATRMKVLGISAVVVGGRVRDIAEIGGLGIPVWSQSTSTVGSGAEAKPVARNVRVSVAGVDVEPGDVVFCDPVEGVVVIPRGLVDGVIEIMPKLVAMDDKVKEAVLKGWNVSRAFKEFRTKI